MEAFEHLLFACHRVDADIVQGFALDGNRASDRTFPFYHIFGGLEDSMQECRAVGCGRQSARLQMTRFLR